MSTTTPKKGSRGKRTPLTPFTLPHFKAYTARIVLDTGEYWELEDFQAEIVAPILDGVTETWAILPEGNAKTTLMAGVGLYHCDFTYAPWVPIGASARDQAEILALQAMDMVRRSPGFLRRFRPYEGYRKITHLRNGGRGIKVYAADANTGDGVIPTLALCDELHRWPDLRLYRLWKGKLNKRGGQIVGISTAGEPGAEFEEQRDRIRLQASQKARFGAHLRSEGPNIVMNEWQVTDPSLVTNIEAVKEANPLSTITIQALREDFESPTTDLGDWKRLKCNIPARSSQTAITEAEWEAALVEDDLQEGDYIDLGVDIAWKHDTTAIVPLLCTDEYRLIGKPEVLVPPRDGSMLDPQEVKDALEGFLDFYVVNTVVMDMHQGADIASWLEHEKGVTVIAWAQGNAQAAIDYEEFMKALRSTVPSERLCHTGDPTLRKHVMNAIARSLPADKRRFDRPSSGRAKRKQETRVIDALMAASWVNSFVSKPPEEEYKLPGPIEAYRVTSLLD
jgi:phage terminase large subunit-like protein